MERIKSIKSKVQDLANKALDDNGGSGLIAIATGGGKSKIGVDRAKMIAGQVDKPNIMLVVPTEKLRDEDWKSEFEKWNAKRVWNKMQRSCYVSANKVKGEHFHLVILDEGHNITPYNNEFFENNTVDNILVLTATEPVDLIKKKLLKDLGIKTVYKIPLDDAVEMKLVAPYQITIVETRLNITDKNIEAGSKEKRFMQTEQGMYEYLTKNIARAMYSTRPNALKWARLNRMRFIYGLKSKTKVAEWILENMIPENEKTIIFSSSIAQAEQLCEFTYHSKSGDEDLDAFRADEISRLSCVKALNEGVNISGLDNALVTQLTSKELDIIQRIGRVVRYRHNHLANIYIIVAINTVDEDWATKALKSFEGTNIRRVRFENLINNNVLENLWEN